MRTTRGFTLIEMLTVVVIVGIILAIGIPLMNNMSRATALQGAAREVSNALQLARQFAITHRTKTEVHIDTTTYNAIFVATNNYPIDKKRYLPVGAIIGPGSDTPIIFKPTGDLVSAAVQRIIVREGIYNTNGTPTWVGLNSNLVTIAVNPLLGKITIQ